MRHNLMGERQEMKLPLFRKEGLGEILKIIRMFVNPPSSPFSKGGDYKGDFYRQTWERMFSCI
ncbi:MAG: hypothetical protein Q8J64_03015 [Thermodesulfovibrionales bacterium]|nr:hypothetical protein [Thermodesulfovibrionales bacterium]